MTAARYTIEWATPAGALAAVEPSLEEVEPLLPRLAAAYNDPHNARLLGHTALLDEDDVRDHYRGLRAAGDRPFLLYRDGALAGDGDLRGIDRGTAEFAFLVADPAAQGRGLGTRFALMVHALGFGPLGLDRIYASVIPTNSASRRVFDKLGYEVDDREAARAYGEDGDVVLSIARDRFLRLHAEAACQLRISPR